MADKDEILIRKVSNGYVLRIDTEGEIEEVVFQDCDDSFDNFRELVSILMEKFITNGNKYSEKKLYLIEAPGFDHDDWSKIVCPLCYRKPEKDEG